MMCRGSGAEGGGAGCLKSGNSTVEISKIFRLSASMFAVCFVCFQKESYVDVAMVTRVHVKGHDMI